MRFRKELVLTVVFLYFSKGVTDTTIFWHSPELLDHWMTPHLLLSSQSNKRGKEDKIVSDCLEISATDLNLIK